MNQQENQDLASSLPVLPRLDRLDRLVQLLEEKHGISGRDTALKKEEEESDESKTNMTLSSALEEVHHKGTLMERLALLETRVLQVLNNNHSYLTYIIYIYNISINCIVSVKYVITSGLLLSLWA
ncbi:uncharacterized protein LOC132051076 [Lycium ferocissimum]|uniref:uncharacterized protein LOC132051076 n=1 Tax=Lycium ferocissimum TaxID=112874 RepID=UPI0028163752|nr:uncharacterized protein LOC132051076 [Lycium ferocissimum]